MPLIVWAKEVNRFASYWREVGKAARNDDGSVTFILFSLAFLTFTISETKPK